jgi:hypothetical protein
VAVRPKLHAVLPMLCSGDLLGSAADAVLRLESMNQDKNMLH